MEPQDFKNKQAGFVFELIEKHQQQQMKYLQQIWFEGQQKKKKPKACKYN